MTDLADFQRLTHHMAHRAAELGVTLPASAVHAPTLQSKFRISHATLAAETDRNQHWADGSTDTILAGGEPTPLPGLPRSVLEQRKDADIRAAVQQAEAVLRLDRERNRLLEEVEQLKGRVAERDGWLKSANEREAATRVRLFAVAYELHGEAEAVACGDGCCHEGLGYCKYCKEPWPCTTNHVAEGRTIEEAQLLVAEQRNQLVDKAQEGKEQA